jgi:two-component system alkaline phosphatase synthesis response regulator PhoP
MKKVIIIEDDDDISTLLELHLNDIPCKVKRFSDGLEGFDYAKKNQFDLMILDINLPGMDGLSICKNLRIAGVTSPILMLTARTGEENLVDGLEHGADDYITKPFGIRELLARVKAIFRRSELNRDTLPADIIRFQELEIEYAKRKVTIAGKVMELSPKEFDLLYLLASHPGVTFSRKDLLHRIWTEDFAGLEHTVNTHINRLRSKIEKDPDNPMYVLTTWGVGYRFDE